MSHSGEQQNVLHGFHPELSKQPQIRAILRKEVQFGILLYKPCIITVRRKRTARLKLKKKKKVSWKLNIRVWSTLTTLWIQAIFLEDWMKADSFDYASYSHTKLTAQQRYVTTMLKWSLRAAWQRRFQTCFYHSAV